MTMFIDSDEFRRLIGKNLQKARYLSGLTQIQAMQKIWNRSPKDRNTNRLSEIENGDKLPSMEVVYKLAKLYGVSLDYIVGMSTEPDADLNASKAGFLMNGMHEMANEMMRNFMPLMSRFVATLPRTEAVHLLEAAKSVTTDYLSITSCDSNFSIRYPMLDRHLHALAIAARSTDVSICKNMRALEMAAEEAMARTDKRENGHLLTSDALQPLSLFEASNT